MARKEKKKVVREGPLTLDQEPHWGTNEYPVGQGDIVQACLEYRNVTALFGRSFGKTLCVRFLFWEEAPRIEDAVYEFIYGAPTQRLARFQYRDWKMWLKPLLTDKFGLDKGSSDNEMQLHVEPMGRNKGSIISFVGLQEYENLRGVRATRVVVDECKDVAQEAVTAVLRPMLLGREGKMLFIGTPSRKGLGASWFKREYHRGQDPEEVAAKDAISFNAPSFANPHLTQKELDDIVRDCDDEKTYREEVLAEILEDDGAVFENLPQVFCIYDPEDAQSLDKARQMEWPIRGYYRQVHKNYWVSEDPDEGTDDRKPHEYVIGLDIGRRVGGDPTVASVFNLATRRQAALLRLPAMPYAEQITEIHNLRKRWRGATIYFDATGGHGSTMRDELAMRYGDGAVPVTWTYTRKEADISAGRFLCQRAGREEDPTFPGPGWYLMAVPWQKSEFADYTMITESKSGERLHNPKYTAPPGMHDDAVCASLLCAQRLKHEWHPAAKPQAGPLFLTGAWLKERVKKQRRAARMKTWIEP